MALRIGALVVGAVCVVGGLAALSAPAGVIAAGVFLCGFGLLSDDGSGGR